MKKSLYLIIMILFTTSIVHAFSNSLSGSNSQSPSLKQNNNFSSVQNNSFKNNLNTPFNPKEHTGFEHQDRNFKDPTMNDTRYNSNCQFGTCTPGGLNPNNR